MGIIFLIIMQEREAQLLQYKEETQNYKQF